MKPDSMLLWNALKGIVCVYKPAETSVRHLRQVLINKLCKDFSELDVKLRYPKPLLDNNLKALPDADSTAVSVTAKTPNTELSTNSVNGPDLRYHPLVVGPRYRDEDLAVTWSNYLGWNTSGVLIFGLRKGTQIAKYMRQNRSTRAYRIKGVFGKATDNGFKTGKVVERSTWKYINQEHIQSILSAMQASHQTKMYEMSGVDMQSQAAFELAKQGLIRPANSKIPMIYSLKCISYGRPNFTIEVHCINEYETYLVNLIHEIGLKLHSTAHATSIKCIRHSCFTLEHALLPKHWNLEHVTQNMEMCNQILMDNEDLLYQDSAALR